MPERELNGKKRMPIANGLWNIFTHMHAIYCVWIEADSFSTILWIVNRLIHYAWVYNAVVYAMCIHIWPFIFQAQIGSCDNFRTNNIYFFFFLFIFLFIIRLIRCTQHSLNVLLSLIFHIFSIVLSYSVELKRNLF